jgi:voltage-gated potassium channel
MNPRRNPNLRFIHPALLLAAVLTYGTLGYLLIERWNVLDAFFMALITITTVGYDEVHPLDAAGKVFTSTLILGGVATIFWALGILTEILSTGELGEWRRQRITEARRRALREHFIVCGYGRMGTQIVLELEADGMPVIVIENNAEALARLRRDAKSFIEGDAASEDALREAGIARARALISAVDSDERAVYVVLAARALRPDLYILSRAGQPESIRRLELAGANRVVSPYRMAGHQLAALAMRPALVEVMETLHHGGADIGVEELVVPSGSTVAGRTLESSGLLDRSCAQLLALRRIDGTMYVNPPPDLRLQEGDLIVALGTAGQLETTAAVLSRPR